jgi:tetratricopeptide (TPR) repeat protein
MFVQSPHRSEPRVNIPMAEDAWLRRGNPAEALNWARVAVEKGRASTQESRLDLSTNLAMLAWAVASASGDRDEVDLAVDEAVSLAKARPVPASCAQVHVNSGRAYAALGDWRKSQEHFDAAARIDPNGLWGRAAKALK